MLTSCPLLLDPVAAPIGTGSETVPEDTDAIHDAAVAEASDGTTQKRDIFKRGTCKSQPSVYTSGPDVSTLTAEQWSALPNWKQAALTANTPQGFYQVANWRALTAAAEAQPYRGFTSNMTSYDTDKCAAKCKDIDGCTSFTIYFERNPKINLDRKTCPTSEAQTIIKCAFYGLSLSANQSTAHGQYTGANFFTSKAGSNAYTLIPPTPPGFSGPVSFGPYTIKAPKGANTLMGTHAYPDSSYNPQMCADVCREKTAFNMREAQRQKKSTYRTCRFYDAYIAYKNDANPVFTCSFFTQGYDPEQATELIQYNDQGDKFTHGSSNGYTLIEQLA